MKKMSTLFRMLYDDDHNSTITQEVRPENEWVYTEPNVIATRKFDGTASMILNNEIYKRYDVKPTKQAFKKHIKRCSCRSNPLFTTRHHKGSLSSLG